MEKLENQANINDSINNSVKLEEQRVIEAANRRMADVHARKAEEANQASKEIDAAKEKREKAVAEAKSAEETAIAKSRAMHASNVVA